MEDTHGAAYDVRYHLFQTVLILIIMEDTHGAISPVEEKKLCYAVLILVIMEDTHGVFWEELVKELQANGVLILIIMEDTHGEPLATTKFTIK